MAAGTGVLRRRARAGGGESLRVALELPSIPLTVARDVRSRSTDLSDHIARRIRAEVDGFADMPEARLEGRLRALVGCTVSVFADAVSGAPTCGTELMDRYRALGRAHARASLSLDSMRAAHHIASQETWDALRDAGRKLSSDALLDLTSGLSEFHTLLLEETIAGYREMNTPQAQARLARAELTRSLISGGPERLVHRCAERCGWTLPPRVVVIIATHQSENVQLDATVIVGTFGQQIVAVAPEEIADGVAQSLLGATDGFLATSWAVKISDTHRAVRWARQTLQLIDDGVIDRPTTRTVRCEDHCTVLSLHADPALRRATDEALLEPLADLSPKQRLALGETLCVWLQLRTSARCLADYLHVHPRTVRLRLQRIREIFGERLDDPEHISSLLIALEFSVPRWRKELGTA